MIALRVATELLRISRLIGQNDMMIAAIARTTPAIAAGLIICTGGEIINDS